MAIVLVCAFYIFPVQHWSQFPLLWYETQFSPWTEKWTTVDSPCIKLTGYCITAFWLGASSNALIKPGVPPAQQLIGSSSEPALNACEQSKTQLLTKRTSRPQWAIVIGINSFPSQKLMFTSPCTLVAAFSNEYTFSGTRTMAVCFSKRMEHWWRAGSKNMVKHRHNMRPISEKMTASHNDWQTIVSVTRNWPSDQTPQLQESLAANAKNTRRDVCRNPIEINNRC